MQVINSGLPRPAKKEDKAKIYNAMGVCYTQLFQVNEASKYFNMALSVCPEYLAPLSGLKKLTDNKILLKTTDPLRRRMGDSNSKGVNHPVNYRWNSELYELKRQANPLDWEANIYYLQSK